MLTAFVLIFAFLWDLLVGDPHYLPHPVRWIGTLISKLESLFNSTHSSPQLQKFLGSLTALIVIASTTLFVWTILSFASMIHNFLFLAIAVLLVGIALASQSLAWAGQEILDLLAQNQVDLARHKLSWIVGRDTGHLEPSEIRRATIETLAENFTDGILSPIFWTVLGGPIACWILKAISTLDSMIAYKNQRYLHFGWASAKLDDIAHFIPARLGAFVIIPIAALACGHSASKTLKIVWRDRLKHPSPNSAHSESAFAGALDLQLGGLSTYQGIPSNKPILGDGKAHFENSDLASCIKLLRMSSLVTVLFGASCAWIFF